MWKFQYCFIIIRGVIKIFRDNPIELPGSSMDNPLTITISFFYLPALHAVGKSEHKKQNTYAVA